MIDRDRETPIRPAAPLACVSQAPVPEPGLSCFCRLWRLVQRFPGYLPDAGGAGRAPGRHSGGTPAAAPQLPHSNGRISRKARGLPTGRPPGGVPRPPNARGARADRPARGFGAPALATPPWPATTAEKSRCCLSASCRPRPAGSRSKTGYREIWWWSAFRADIQSSPWRRD